MKKMQSASNPFQFKNQWETIAWNYEIGAINRLVLLYLILKADHADGASCYPSVKLIAKKTELSERAVQRAMTALEGMGILIRNKRVGYTNVYEFCDPTGFSAVPMKPNAPTPASVTPRQPVTTDCVTGEGCHSDGGGVTVWREGGDCVAPNHNHIPESLTKISYQEAAATRTHEGERTHEPREAAAAAPKGQDLNLDQPKQAAAASREPAQTSTAASQDEPSEELVVWLGTTIKGRVAGLVQTPGEVKRRQVTAAVRTLKRWAKGDEAQVRAYLADELDRQEGRDDHEKARGVATLIGWLADKRSWATWRDAAPSAVSLTGGKPINRGRPPRPGLVWNEHVNNWINATEQRTGIYKNINLGSDDDDIVYDANGVPR